MAVTLLRGQDEFRIVKFWDSFKSRGLNKEALKGEVSSVVNILSTPHLFGNSVFLIEDVKIISSVTDFLLRNEVPHEVVLVQGVSSEACFRRLARKFEVVTCDPIWSYKADEVLKWIFDLSNGMGISITYQDSQLLLDNLGEESLEIARVLELHKLSGEDISSIVQYDTGKALLVLIDSVARHSYDLAIKTLVYLQTQGVGFIQVASALLTRYELLLKIKASYALGADDESVKKNLRLSRMIAGNVLSEARMNAFPELIKLMKNLIVNSTNPCGFDWFILVLLKMREVRR